MTDNKETQQQELKLGDMYYSGDDGVEINKKQAFEHYLAAAKLGSAEAAHYIADMYEDGDGVKENHEESLKWLTESAQNDYSPAQYDLAVHYYNNDDYENALIWFYHSHTNGDKTAKKEIKDIIQDHPEVIASLFVLVQELKTKVKKLEKKVKKLNNKDDDE